MHPAAFLALLTIAMLLVAMLRLELNFRRTAEAGSAPESLESPTRTARSQARASGVAGWRLWSVALVCRGLAPGLRVVAGSRGPRFDMLRPPDRRPSGDLRLFVICSRHGASPPPSLESPPWPRFEPSRCAVLAAGGQAEAKVHGFGARHDELRELRPASPPARTARCGRSAAFRPGAPASLCSVSAAAAPTCGSAGRRRGACPRPARSGPRPRRPRRSRCASPPP